MDAARLRPHHSRTHSHASDYASDYQSSDDGYDYNNVEDAPEAQPTKPKALDLANFRQSPIEGNVQKKSDVADNAFTETMPHIFQRYAGGRRAKIPTDIDVDLEKGANGSASTDKKGSLNAAPKLTNIKLRWTMPEIKGKRMLHLNYDRADLESQQPYLQRRRVRWQ